MALFLRLAELADGLAGEASRLKKRAAIAAAIAEVAGESIEDAGLFAMYLAGMPFAEADGRKLNAGGALLSKALLSVSGASDAELGIAYRKYGDMGAAAVDLMAAAARGGRHPTLPPLGVNSTRRGPRLSDEAGKDGAPERSGMREEGGRASHDAHLSRKVRGEDGAPGFGGGLTIGEVAAVFAGMAGARTTAVRLALVEGLLRRARPVEVKYLLKLMLGDMRIGVKESLVEEAIAGAASSRDQGTGNRDQARDQGSGNRAQAGGVSVGAVRHAVMLEADLSAAVRRAFEGTLGAARMRLFHPLGFMLASPVDSPEEAVERFVTDGGTNSAEAEEKIKPKKRAKAGPSTAAAKSAAFAQDDTSMVATQDDSPVATDEAPSMIAAHDDSMVATQNDSPGATEEDISMVAAHDDSVVAAQSDSMIATEEDISLAKTKSIEAFLEDKFDGMRAQVHCGDAEQPGRVAIYSRNREDVTESFPELEEAFARVADAGVGATIFDGEILGWDLKEARALPFAVLGQRIGRKKVSNEWRERVPVVFMAFDLMVAEGELMLERPLRERRNKLEAVAERLVEVVRAPVLVDEVKVSKRRKGLEGQAELFGGVEVVAEIGEHPILSPSTRKDGAPGSEGVERLMLSDVRLVESAEDIDRAYAEARARANEGVMLKAAESVYQPGRRGLAWVKLKRELATLDVVVTGAEFGHGKRAGILSDYTFAVRDAGSTKTGGELLNVGKAYSGLTDAEIGEMSAWMMAHTLEDQGHFRTVEPLMVLEVAFNNVMRSGRHASGFALRFPRIVRIRTDKPVEEIDTVARVEEVYQSQVDKPMEA